MNIVIIGSSGGSAFREIHEILSRQRRYSFFVITDRACGLEDYAHDAGLAHLRICDADNRSFSVKAMAAISAHASLHGPIAFALLFFSRLVTSDLFESVPTFNLHPALLPAFPGMGSVRKALQAKVRFFGTSLHRVDSSMDGGALVAQAALAIHPQNETEERLNKYAFVQKVALSLVLVEQMTGGNLRLESGGRISFLEPPTLSDRCSPWLNSAELKSALISLQKREGITVFREGQV